MGGEIAAGEGGEWIVTPLAGVKEVTIAGLPDGAAVAVPPTVTQVGGVADSQIKVKSGAYDITGAFTVAGGAIALDENGAVTIGGEKIPVKPVIGDWDEGEAFVVGEGCVTVKVKAIPGLKYELRRGETVEAIAAGSSIPPYQTVAVVETATGTRVTLIDAEPLKGAAFYRIEVSAP